MVDDAEREIKAVFVPWGVSLPLETITIHQPKGKALLCFIHHCKVHFAKDSLTKDQLSAVTANLQKQVSKDAKNKTENGGNATQELIERVASMTACDMVVLQPNKPLTEYISKS